MRARPRPDDPRATTFGPKAPNDKANRGRRPRGSPPGPRHDPVRSRPRPATIADLRASRSPVPSGATLTSKEKLDIARNLAKLGVDIIEAGFPIASLTTSRLSATSPRTSVTRSTPMATSPSSAAYPALTRRTSTPRGRASGTPSAPAFTPSSRLPRFTWSPSSARPPTRWCRSRWTA